MVGLIILGGIAAGYTYSKRAMIASNQQTEVQAFRTFVESARSAKQDAGISNYGPVLTIDQMCGVLTKIPGMQVDPYTGVARKPNEPITLPCTGPSITTSGDH